VGGTMFGFVVGLMITFLAYGLGPILASRFRESATLRHLASKAGLDRATLPRWSMTTLVFSLLIGVWTHLFFDSFTHTDGLLVKHVGFLQSEVTKIGTHSVRICHLLWYACSFAGVAILVLAFRDWQASTGFHSSIRSGRRRLVEALVVPLFILPIELGHHFVHTRLALLLVIVLTLAVVIAFMLGSARARQIENPVEGRKTGVQ
jgi:hypothetical protein